jgi:hypothetical protein
MAGELIYAWRGSKLLPARLGQRCMVVARENNGTEVVVRFEDGRRALWDRVYPRAPYGGGS